MASSLQKRFWRVQFVDVDCCPINIKSIHHMCAICRWELKGTCIDCFVDGHFTTYRDHAKYIFTLLHVLQKRRDSLFYNMEKGVLEKIIRFALQPDPVKMLCSVVILECGHMYHRHCLEKWVQKRPVCPLEGSRKIMPVSIKAKWRTPYTARIVVVTENQMVRMEKKRKILEAQRKEKMEHNSILEGVKNVIADTLKHNKFGLVYDDLLLETRNFFKRYVEAEIFYEALKYAMEKQVVYLIDGKYLHVIHTEFY